MPSVEWNAETWDIAHGWELAGDEWSGLADYSGQPYVEWKRALVESHILPYVGPESDVLEVAPGYGRWTESIVPNARTVWLVDLSPTCIEACKRRFADAKNVQYFVNDGRSLPEEASRSIDFIWSFDSFVHIEADVIDAYLGEFARVLRPGGRFAIHHADKRDWSLRMVPFTRRLGRAGRVIQRMASQGRLRDSGQRANVSSQLFGRLAVRHGLVMESQDDHWGPNGEYNVAKFHDVISVGTKV